VCTPCELPNAAATARSLLPQSNILQATGVTRAYSSRVLMGSWLLVCAGMECHKVVNTFVLYYRCTCRRCNANCGGMIRRQCDGRVVHCCTIIYARAAFVSLVSLTPKEALPLALCLEVCSLFPRDFLSKVTNRSERRTPAYTR
jgi:hypothetical protein